MYDPRDSSAVFIYSQCLLPGATTTTTTTFFLFFLFSYISFQVYYRRYVTIRRHTSEHPPKKFPVCIRKEKKDVALFADKLLFFPLIIIIIINIVGLSKMDASIV